jgi:hypothetical protein
MLFICSSQNLCQISQILTFYLQWNNDDRNPMVQNVSERIFQMLKVCRVNSLEGNASDIRQLPPSVVEIKGRQAAFPLGLGHAVDYISNKAALIGYVL